MLPLEILALLQCPECDSPNVLVAPTTTRAGVTLCASHILEFPELYDSTHIVPEIPVILPLSNVVYIPAPQVPLPETLPQPGKTDVTVNNILQLTHRWAEIYSRHMSGWRELSELGISWKRRRRSGSFSTPRGESSPARRIPSQSPPPSSSEDNDTLAQYAIDLSSELTCQVCYTLLYQPMTTPCQHTFCMECLLRSLDHSNACPTCRQDLPSFAYFQDRPLNRVIRSILLNAFPDEYRERESTTAAEECKAHLDTPIFVCQLSFPGIPTRLHLFEPRYRLMLRRCLENPYPKFGMIMPPGETTEFGTMLEIKSVQMLADGRSVVETVGSYRFRVLERGTQDGYMVARIEQFEDVPPSIEALFSCPSPSLGTFEQSTADLMIKCTTFLARLEHSSAPWIVQRLIDTCGPQPFDPAQFTFWIAMVLPIAEHEKVKLLAIKSPKMRLQLIVHWIETLQENRYFSNQCLVM